MQTRRILLLTLILAFIFSNVYAAKLSGVVIDDKNQNVTNANVNLYGVASSTSDTLFYSGTSDENGQFSFDNLQGGTYYVDAQTVIETRPVMNVWSKLTGPINVEQNNEIQDVVIEFVYVLSENGGLSGYVKTDTGQPLEGLEVEAYSNDTVNSDENKSHTFSYFTTTDANGHYAFQKIMAGKYHIASSHPIGGSKENDELIQVFANAEATASDIVYTADEISKGYITGSVLFGDGSTPVVGASIEFITIDPDTGYAFYKNAKVETGVDGKYKLSVAPGEYIVMCQYSDSDVPFFAEYYEGAKDIAAAKLVKVSTDQAVSDIDFSVPAPKVISKVTISGKVTDDQGNALAAATVELFFKQSFYSSDSVSYSEKTTADANGNYSFELKDVKSPLTEIIISAFSSGYFKEFNNNKNEYYLADPLIPGEKTVFENIDFSLSPLPKVSTNTISGIVLSEAGKAISGAVISAYHSNDVNVISTRTDSEGKYELTNLYEGKYVIQFYAANYVPEFYNDVENWEQAQALYLSQSLNNIDATLTSFAADSSSGKVMGSVVSEDGAELGGVLVSVKNSNGKTVGFDFTNNQGQYWIEGLEKGTLTVIANRVQYNVASNAISLLAPSKICNLSLKKVNDATFVADEGSNGNIATNFELQGNYPNPFNPETSIHFALSQPAQVSVSVYNMLGQEIYQAQSNSVVSGNQSIKWNGMNKQGVIVQSGVYFYKISAAFTNGNKETQTGRMLLLK